MTVPSGQPHHEDRVIRLGAYAVCLDQDRRILLCRMAPGYPRAGAWTLPGGGVQFGEDPNEAVLRELAEETGLTGVIDGLFGVYSRHFPPTESRSGRDIHVVGLLFRIRIAGGILRDEVDESTDRSAWLDLDDLAHLEVVDLAAFALRLLAAPPD